MSNHDASQPPDVASSQASLDYWKQQLDGGLSALELSPDRSRSAAQAFREATYSFTLDRSRSQIEALRTLSQQAGVSVFVTLLATFKILLQRHTGQTDILVGIPIAGRVPAATLALRTDLSGDPSFRELLGRIHEVTSGAYAHQDLSFEELLVELSPQHAPSQISPLRIMFIFQAAAQKRPEPTWPAIDNGTTRFDLALALDEVNQELSGTIQYNADLFDEATIVRVADHLQILLEGIVTTEGSLDRRLSNLPLLTMAEQHLLLEPWNDTRLSYPHEARLHSLFETQVAWAPDAIAVVYKDHELASGELNRRANQVAHHLQRLGVGPETLVGICLERTLEMVVGLLGILKAGGAYVPLDPAYPQDRLDFILQNSQASIVLTQASLLDRLPVHRARCLCLDGDWQVFAQEPIDNPSSPVLSQNLAYVIYTSGSTGQPKGVAIQHGNGVAFIHWAHRVFEPAILKGVLAATSICFDLSVFEIFATLSGGGTVVLAQNALHLPDLPAASRVTLVNTVPSAAKELLRGRGIPESVRVVNLAGEPLSQGLVEELYRSRTIERVYDLYGPSETTTYSTHVLREIGGRRTIGRPIGNTQVYLLDKHLNPAPIGVPGEVYIGGKGVTRGYLNRPELTSDKFIPDPFGNELGARLYRTGDLARYWPDGNLEFLGRIDRQVKIRGYRIELGEIEAVLGQHPAVREAVVVAREDRSGDNRLVAYVVPRASVPETGELRHFLRDKLPEYMIPAVFVMLEALPLTPNGKVDRQALPAPEQTGHRLRKGFVAAHTPIEQTLTEIWAEVLGIQPIGIHDNFFELGGHSLLATQITSRLRSWSGREYPVRVLFERPTVADLAEFVQGAGDALPAQAVPIKPASRTEPIPLSFTQQQLWLIDQLEPGNAAYNVPVIMRLAGLLDVAVLRESLNEIVRRHEALRTTFVVVDEQPIQVIAAALTLHLPIVDLRQLAKLDCEEESQRLARAEARRPFDLAQGPLIRATLLWPEAEEYWVLLNMHHTVTDAWSMGVFARELGTLYAAYLERKPSPLETLPIQYADFTVWQRQWLQNQVLETQLVYWKHQLCNAPAALTLPTDRPRAPVQTFHGTRLSWVLGSSWNESIRALSQQAGCTLFMTLLAAFKALLYHYTGQTDIVIGSPIANRNRAETEGVIGFFVNTLVLRTNLAGDPTFYGLLARIRETVLDAHAHQDLAKLVEALRPERSRDYNPFFSIMFDLNNMPSMSPTLPCLKATAIEIDTGLAQFDLSLEIQETEQGIEGIVEYNVDLFDALTITRMGEHYRTLLENVAANSDLVLSALLPPHIPKQQSFSVASEVEQASASPGLKDKIARRRNNLSARRSKLPTAQQTLIEKRLRGG